MPAAKFWPRESRNLIGPLTIELSTEVNCLRDLLTIFNPTAMAKEQVCQGKRVAQRYSRRSRRIVIISFSPENGVQFDASCLSLGAEKYSNSEVCIPFYRIRVSKFSFEGFQASIENVSRVVVVSAFYETKRTASIFRQE